MLIEDAGATCGPLSEQTSSYIYIYIYINPSVCDCHHILASTVRAGAIPPQKLHEPSVQTEAQPSNRTQPSIHNRGLCGHIEEVSIAKEQQGKGFGQRMLAALDSVAKNLGCYKTILDCSVDKEPFYVKCQYHNSGTEMSHYYEEWKEPYYRG